MVKRIVIFIIFVSMGLHSASRLGLVSYLYQQRYSLAVMLGVSSEVPITLCSHQQGPDFNLPILDVDGHADHQNLPPANNLRAPELQLFIAQHLDVLPERPLISFAPARGTTHTVGTYNSPTLSIFHPPS